MKFAAYYYETNSNRYILQLTKIYGHGKQTRSFQYVTDLVDGLVALMNSSYTLPINLGNPIEHNIDGIIYPKT
jgi:nucleoside-diphosphate-sugar epimerase